MTRVGQGIGKALVSEIIRICEAMGLRQMVAVVGDSAHLTGPDALGWILYPTPQWRNDRWATRAASCTERRPGS